LQGKFRETVIKFPNQVIGFIHVSIKRVAKGCIYVGMNPAESIAIPVLKSVIPVSARTMFQNNAGLLRMLLLSVMVVKE
jgi:hypothetical protein